MSQHVPQKENEKPIDDLTWTQQLLGLGLFIAILVAITVWRNLPAEKPPGEQPVVRVEEKGNELTFTVTSVLRGSQDADMLIREKKSQWIRRWEEDHPGKELSISEEVTVSHAVKFFQK